jgi:hypothetical protein
VITPTSGLRLLSSPAATYRALAPHAAASARPAWASVLARAAGAAAIVGIATAITATGRIDWQLAVSGTAGWSFVAILQLAAAAVAIAAAGQRRPTAVALDLFFAAHAAWSLWLLAAAAFLAAAPPALGRLDAVLATAVVPFVWTAVVVFAFFRVVLRLERRAAVLGAVLHQILIVTMVLLYFAWAVQLWPRILGAQAS